MDMFPDMPRDPKPKPEDRIPGDVRDVVRGLRGLAKERARPTSEQLLLKLAADLLTEAWTGERS